MIQYDPKKHKNVDIYEMRSRYEHDNYVTYAEKVIDLKVLEMAKRHPSGFWVKGNK